jgi:hypothetical protein
MTSRRTTSGMKKAVRLGEPLTCSVYERDDTPPASAAR